MPFNGCIACEERLDPLRDAFAPKEDGFILATDPLQLLSSAGGVLGGPVTRVRPRSAGAPAAGWPVRDRARACAGSGRPTPFHVSRPNAPPWHIAGRRLRTADVWLLRSRPGKAWDQRAMRSRFSNASFHCTARPRGRFLRETRPVTAVAVSDGAGLRAGGRPSRRGKRMRTVDIGRIAPMASAHRCADSPYATSRTADIGT